MIMSTLVVLVALLALVSPIWLYAMQEAEPESIDEGYPDRLEHITAYIMDESDIDLLEELMLILSARRMLIHTHLTEGHTRLA